MTKKELVDTVAEKLNISQKSAENAVTITLAAIGSGLSRGDSVAIPKFGAFSVRERPERKARNPRTGEEITVPARKIIVFKAGKSLSEAIQ